MVIAEIKPFEELTRMLEPYDRVLNAGCAGCTAVCQAGGQREVNELNARLSGYFKKAGKKLSIKGITIERQCDPYFMRELEPGIASFDAVISMGCGAGVQMIAAHFDDMPVLPALNTVFIGSKTDSGIYSDSCSACGNCRLAYTAGICVIAGCSKNLFNGPCGGVRNGKCEVSEEIDCAWNDIYQRLKKQGRLDELMSITEAVEWKDQVPGRVFNGGRYRREG